MGFDIRVISLFAIIVFVLFIFLYVSGADVEYGINILDGDVPRGTDVELFYEINNKLFSGDVENVRFYYNINEQTGEEFVPIGLLKSGDSSRGSVILETANLPNGEHTILTRLTYWRDGIMNAKYLTLKLVVY